MVLKNKQYLFTGCENDIPYKQFGLRTMPGTLLTD